MLARDVLKCSALLYVICKGDLV